MHPPESAVHFGGCIGVHFGAFSLFEHLIYSL